MSCLDSGGNERGVEAFTRGRLMGRNQFTALPVRAVWVARHFFTDRTAILNLKEIERQDMEEVRQYHICR